MKPLLFLLALVLSFVTVNHAHAKDVNTAATKQIETVIETFRTSIINKDEDKFVKLFLFESIPWQSVKSDDTLQRIRQKRPEAMKVAVNPKSNYLSFIDDIVASKDKQEEKFWNVKIDTDGDIASVFFDYSFHSNDRETNHGKEAWHLVRTEDGWKIISVIYSIILSPEPAK